MNKEYLKIAQTLIENVTVIIYRFYVVRYCTWPLKNVRKRYQKNLPPEQRKNFKRSRRLLLAHKAPLSDDNKQAVCLYCGNPQVQTVPDYTPKLGTLHP